MRGPLSGNGTSCSSPAPFPGLSLTLQLVSVDFPWGSLTLVITAGDSVT